MYPNVQYSLICPHQIPYDHRNPFYMEQFPPHLPSPNIILWKSGPWWLTAQTRATPSTPATAPRINKVIRIFSTQLCMHITQIGHCEATEDVNVVLDIIINAKSSTHSSVGWLASMLTSITSVICRTSCFRLWNANPCIKLEIVQATGKSGDSSCVQFPLSGFQLGLFSRVEDIFRLFRILRVSRRKAMSFGRIWLWRRSFKLHRLLGSASLLEEKWKQEKHRNEEFPWTRNYVTCFLTSTFAM